MEVTLIDHMGSDLSVVNAARVSFAKTKEVLDESDERLIYYLATHKHWSPFAHTSIQLRIKAPIFVARQLVKHQVGGSWNEVSRRYVKDTPEFYEPTKWRLAADNVKQGSSDEEVDIWSITHTSECGTLPNSLGALVSDAQRSAEIAYEYALECGLAPEMARMVLPQSMMTEWYWTGSLFFFARVCNERLAPGAQRETGMVADLIDEHCRNLFPVSWRALRQ